VEKALDNAQSPKELVQRGLRSSLIGIGFNLALASFKCAAGFVGHSFALTADGIESLSDVVSSSIVYFGLRLAIKPPDRKHPYGHGKAEPIAAMKTPTKPSLTRIWHPREQKQ
jgi:divalent metal cation (Fe/Co/Zn/Cd) transporter